ncbi:PREDICTED: pentatricopeptide repeat-containing protein At2g29760, chloroplastic-like [Nelumbo nucifera]|nr:PREDICTED: pentatricopeptide repeat-containing protein At2g29760, chloroplastic-like [Nelumbo nucifera]
MIRVYSKTRDFELSIALYKEMLLKGAKPNWITFSFVSKAAADLGTLEVLLGLHCQVLILGFCSDVFVLNSLILGYSGCGPVDYARKVFDELPERDLISWTVVLNGYVRSGRAKEAVELFFLMREEQVMFDEVVVVAVFTACAQLRDLHLSRRLESLVRECKVGFNSYMSNALIDMYSKCGSIIDARKHFDEMVDKDVVSWNSMVSAYGRAGNADEARKLFDQIPVKNEISWSALLNGYVQNGAFKEALLLFSEMKAKGIIANDTAITGAVTACAHMGSLDLGRQIHSSLDKEKIKSDVVLSTSLVDMYVKCGCLDTAQQVFNEISKKNLVCYNVTMLGLAIHGKASECLKIFCNMAKGGLAPDSTTFVAILSACAHAGWLEEGQKWFRLMTTAHGIAPRAEHVSCMVHLMGGLGFLDEAHGFIKTSSVKPDVVIWGALLSACKVHGNLKLGKLATQRILELDPSHGGAYILFSGMLAAGNKWDEVMEVRKKMKEIGVENRRGWSCIDLQGNVHEFHVGKSFHPEIKEILPVLGSLNIQTALSG